MKKPAAQLRTLKKLRARAEALVRHTPRPAAELLQEGQHRLIHELQVHQTELEMQNEELRRIQAELEASRDGYTELYDFAPSGYVTLDHKSVIVQANLTACTLLGLSRSQLLRKPFPRFVAPESQDTFYFQQRKLQATGGKETCRLALRKANGACFPAELVSIPIGLGQRGAPSRSLVAFNDLTERLAEELDRARLAAIVESSEDAIFAQALDGTITSWNAAAERLYGYSAAEAIGQPISLLLPSDAASDPSLADRWRALNQLGEPFETIQRCKDGSQIPVSVSISPLKNTLGGVVGLSAIVRDIRRRKQMERSLHESEAALTDFFAESPLGLLWVTEEGGILRVNRALLEMLGCTLEEVSGHPVAEFHSDPEIASNLLDRLARRETVQNYRARLRRKDGSVKHVLIDANGLWDKNRLVHSRWFVRDITQRVELEREILAIAEREQRRLGQDLHDDFCQRLTGIEFLCQTLAGDLAGLSKAGAARAKELARMLRDAIGHARELAHGLSPVSKGKQGLMLGLRELAARTRKVFRCDCQFLCPSPVLIRDDETSAHLYRIAQEAVNNALKHGKAQRIEIGLTAQNGRIVLCVRDNGIGLPIRRPKRRGIGLRVMQYRAGVINGSLAVQRRHDGGTEVVCTVKNDKTTKRTSDSSASPL